MLITWNGHSEFLLESETGYRILTDPYDAHVGYSMKRIAAEAVTVSHAHRDHSYTAKVSGTPRILNTAGECDLAPRVRVSAYPAYHDAQKGILRGNNLVFLIEMDGLRITHMGDLGERPNPELIGSLGSVDILMLPVGGHFTIGPSEAADTVCSIAPRVVIPMHYRTQVNADWPIAEVSDFLFLVGAETVKPQPILRVTKGDLGEQPKVVVFSYSG